MNPSRSAVVVGAGIVGLCCALELQRRGWQVTVVDRGGPGQACSAGNAGILASQAVVPLALPGLWKQLPQWLLSREGPLALRLGSLPHTLPWLLRMAGSAGLAQVQRSAAAMKTLYGSTVERHQALAAEAGAPQLVRAQPGLYVHRDPAALDTEGGLAWRLRRTHGATIERLEGEALRQAEPALSPAYRVAVRMGPMGFATEPLRLAEAHAALLQRRGGVLRRAEVRALRPADHGVQLQLDGESVDAAIAVVAAGAWTRTLLAPLGCPVPVVAERGYHLTYADPGVTLNHVVTEVEAHVAVSPMDCGLRIAGTEEIGLADDPPDWRRAALLDGVMRRMVPTLRPGEGQRWMGPRPGTPDSLPLIGRVPGQGSMFVAAGHGHLGLTGAPHTGALVAQLASGEPPGIDLKPFDPLRFLS
ncbi:MAG: FAD-dependent oxidoreductase [Rubrivivax sp.]